MNCACPRVSTPTTGTRVDCALGDTIASRSPTSAFKSDDLPTFGSPASTTVPHRVDAIASAPDGARGGDEGVEQPPHSRVDVDQVLGMPLHAEHESVVGDLDPFDQAIRRGGHRGESRCEARDP